MYIINGKEYQENSSINQDIKRQFIDREVMYCQSYLVQELFDKEIVTIDDIENLCIDAEKEYKDYGYEYADDMRDDGADIQEIYEYWIVTDWLLEKLKAKGEPILSTDFGDWWGRTTTGQAILLDSVISEICKDMEILEGQSSDWSKQ